MKNRNLRRNNSGQVIVITALMVALVLLSTAIFVISSEKNVPTAVPDTDNVFSAYQQAIRNTLISALANATNGGNPDVLTTDLNELTSAFASNSYQSILQVEVTPQNEAPYQNGLDLSWGTNGQGTSSACVSIEINSTGTTSSANLDSSINVTSEIDLSGSYLQLGNNLTQVNLNINVRDDGSPALAQSIYLYFENSTQAWVNVDSPSLNDFGNGTYAMSFTAESSQLSSPVYVSAVCVDLRGVLIEANATCTYTG